MMAACVSFTFWQPRRPTRVTDVSTRCTPCRMRTTSIFSPVHTSVNFHVRNFRLYGKLRKTDTEIHNSLPTIETIQTERSLMTFDQQRHITPDSANYEEFYRGLASSVTPHPSRLDTVRSSTASTRSLDFRRNTCFSLTSQSARSAADSTCTQLVFPRLTTSYSLKLSDSQQTDRVSRPSVSGSKPTGSKSLAVQISNLAK